MKACFPSLDEIFEILCKPATRYLTPPLGTPVYLDPIFPALSVVMKSPSTFSEICNACCGKWMIQPSGTFLQINQTNVAKLMSPQQLEDSAFIYMNDGKFFPDPDCPPPHILRFVFQQKHQSFVHLIHNSAFEYLKIKNSFTLDQFIKLIIGKLYRSPIGSLETISYQDKFRIQQIFSHSIDLIAEEDCYKLSDNDFGESLPLLDKNELLLNQIIRIIEIRDPFHNGLTQKDIKKICRFYSIKMDDQLFTEFKNHERVFQYDEYFGVREEFEFSSETPKQILENGMYFYEVLWNTLQKQSAPISEEDFIHLLVGTEYIKADGTESIIDDSCNPVISSFLKHYPPIICQNNQFYLIPRIIECDYYGGLYVRVAKNFINKNIENLGKIEACEQMIQFRIPVNQNNCVFMSRITQPSTQFLRLLDISKPFKKIDFKLKKDIKAGEVELITPTKTTSIEFSQKHESSESPTYSSNQSPVQSRDSSPEPQEKYSNTKVVKTGTKNKKTNEEKQKESKKIETDEDIIENMLIEGYPSLKSHGGNYYHSSSYFEILEGQSFKNIKGKNVFITNKYKKVIENILENSKFFYKGRAKPGFPPKYAYKGNIEEIDENKRVFDSVASLYEWGLEKLHLRTKSSIPSFTNKELANEVEGQYYNKQANKKKITLRYDMSAGFQASITCLARATSSPIVFDIEKGLYGLRKYCPTWTINDASVSEQAKWSSQVRKKYQQIRKEAHAPTREDQRIFEENERKILNALVEKNYENEEPRKETHRSKYTVNETEKPPVMYKIEYVHDSDSEESYSESSSEAEVLSSNDANKSYRRNDEHRRSMHENEWEDPELSFEDDQYLSLMKLQFLKKSYFNKVPIGLQAPLERFTMPVPLIHAIDQEIRSQKHFEISKTIEKLYPIFGNGKSMKAFSNEFLITLGELETQRLYS